MAKAIYNFYERIELIHVVDKIVDMHILARIERRGHTDCIALTPEQVRYFMELPIERLYWDVDEEIHKARFDGPPESRPEIFRYPDEVQFDRFEILRAVEVDQISPNEAQRRFGDMSCTNIYTDATPPAEPTRSQKAHHAAGVIGALLATEIKDDLLPQEIEGLQNALDLLKEIYDGTLVPREED